MTVMIDGRRRSKHSNVGTKGLDEETIRETYRVFLECEENYSEAARRLGLTNGKDVKKRLLNAERRGITLEEPAVDMPVFPEDDIPAEQILDQMEKRFAQRLKHDQALQWFKIGLRDNKPMGLATVGDPHIGSNGCNVTLLRRDVDLLAKTAGVYAVNIGDSVDNWGGRLIHLYAENDVSKQTERRLARWFLQDSGVPWIVWLLGNHDAMDGGFATYLKAINASTLPMLDWQSKFRLAFPNGKELRCNFAHNHKGTSVYNKLHGQKRESLWHGAEMADLIVAGHHHNAAYQQEETDDGRIVTMARARGYKWIDSHATTHGFRNNEHGATLLFVIDPTTDNPAKFVTPFMDLEAGVDFLNHLRAR